MSLVLQLRPECIGRSSIHRIRTDVDEITMIPQNALHPVVRWGFERPGQRVWRSFSATVPVSSFRYCDDGRWSMILHVHTPDAKEDVGQADYPHISYGHLCKISNAR